MNYSKDQLELLNSNRGIRYLMTSDEFEPKEVIEKLQYEKKLVKLQAELIKMQNWVIENNKRVIIILEGRDFAGKGGTIRAMSEHLNPRAYRLVALNKPTERESGQWYFKRYIKQLPEKGEVVFFDRSWYNRAVVEPVNGFCSPAQYQRFMGEVNYFEKMLIEDGIYLFKIFLSISKSEQSRRFKEVKANPLTRWQFTEVDLNAQKYWTKYTDYIERMFKKTNKKKNPWHIFDGNKIRKARLDAIKLILDKIPYKGNA